MRKEKAWIAVLKWASLAVATVAGALAAGTGPIRPEEALAIVTRPEGEVWVKERSSRRSWPARPLQAVGEGATLELGKGAQLNLLCRDGGLLELDESGVLTVRRCREARRRAPGRFAALVPDGGRLKVLAGSWTLEGETRDDKADYGLRPVLLAPRCPLDEAHRLGCSRLLRTPTSIRWAAVPTADRYSLRLNGFKDVVVPADEVACDEGGDGVNYRICSLAWPGGWRLEPENSYFLQIEARTGLFDQETSEKTKIELLPEDEAVAIERELAGIAELDFDSVTQGLLAAVVLGERGLVNGSLAAMQSTFGERLDGVLRVALGDVYRRVDLLYPSWCQYEQVLAEPDASPAVQAAAELGLGWVYDRWAVHERALAHLERARVLYARLGLTKDAGIAQRLIDKQRK